MLKNLENTIVNMLLFWVLTLTMPGIDSPNGSIGYFVGGLLYGILMVLLPEVLRFFKFPKNFWGRFLIGSALTFMLVMGLNFFTPDLLVVNAGYVGDFNLVWYSTPKLITLGSPLAVGVFISVILNLCSIILDFLKKGKF